jgi:hypothetical protein
LNTGRFERIVCLDAHETITTTDSHPGCTNIPGVTVVPALATMRRRLEADLEYPGEAS